MLNKSMRYSALSVDLVHLEPGESFTFQQKPASSSYGIFALGGTRSADDARGDRAAGTEDAGGENLLVDEGRQGAAQLRCRCHASYRS